MKTRIVLFIAALLIWSSTALAQWYTNSDYSAAIANTGTVTTSVLSILGQQNNQLSPTAEAATVVSIGGQFNQDANHIEWIYQPTVDTGIKVRTVGIGGGTMGIRNDLYCGMLIK